MGLQLPWKVPGEEVRGSIRTKNVNMCVKTESPKEKEEVLLHAFGINAC